MSKVAEDLEDRFSHRWNCLHLDNQIRTCWNTVQRKLYYLISVALTSLCWSKFILLCVILKIFYPHSRGLEQIRNNFIPKRHLFCPEPMFHPRVHVDYEMCLLLLCKFRPRDWRRTRIRWIWRSEERKKITRAKKKSDVNNTLIKPFPSTSRQIGNINIFVSTWSTVKDWVRDVYLS